MTNNLKTSTVISELIAEDLAGTFLTTQFGSDIFIGSDIQQILAEQTNIIYQDIDDPNYSGASISYKGNHFIALNTHQTLRARYYSAAHELWHLSLDINLFGSEVTKKKINQLRDFDSERAADHFAAAIMMPKDVMIRTWNKYVKDQTKPNVTTAKNAIIRIANMSSMPYQAVTRRLSELHLLLSTQLLELSEDDWQKYVASSDFPPSPLDRIEPFKKFSSYTDVVSKLVAKKQLTLLEAAQLVTYADPTIATDYLEKRQTLVNQIEEGN